MVIYFASARWFKVCGSIVCKDSNVFYEYGTDTVCIVSDIIQVLQCLHIKYSELWSSLGWQSLGMVRFKACLVFFVAMKTWGTRAGLWLLPLNIYTSSRNWQARWWETGNALGQAARPLAVLQWLVSYSPSICETPIKMKVILTKVYYQSRILIPFCFWPRFHHKYCCHT